VIQTELLLVEKDLIHIYERSADPYEGAYAPHVSDRKVEWWEITLVFSLMAGAWVSGRLSGARLLPRPPEQTVTAFIGGLLLGAGAALGFGCTIGHVMSGWALMSVGSLIFGFSLILSAWVTTFFYLRGARS